MAFFSRILPNYNLGLKWLQEGVQYQHLFEEKTFTSTEMSTENTE